MDTDFNLATSSSLSLAAELVRFVWRYKSRSSLLRTMYSYGLSMEAYVEKFANRDTWSFLYGG